MRVKHIVYDEPQIGLWLGGLVFVHGAAQFLVAVMALFAVAMWDAVFPLDVTSAMWLWAELFVFGASIMGYRVAMRWSEWDTVKAVRHEVV
jgi:hypothetical protein